jgi:hypothetical protein
MLLTSGIIIGWEYGGLFSRRIPSYGVVMEGNANYKLFYDAEATQPIADGGQLVFGHGTNGATYLATVYMRNYGKPLTASIRWENPNWAYEEGDMSLSWDFDGKVLQTNTTDVMILEMIIHRALPPAVDGSHNYTYRLIFHADVAS